MYDQSYEEYMNSILGTRNDMMQMPAQMQTQMNTYPEMNNFYMNNVSQPIMPQAQVVETIEEMYPDMYKMVFPMVVKRCEGVNEPITEDLITKMTDEIYYSIEATETEKKVEIKAEVPMNKRCLSSEPRGSETRQFGRREPIRDLIRILLLRQLIDGRFPGHRHDHRHRRPFYHRSLYEPYMY